MLAAECLGTGVLALPYQLNVLGGGGGYLFLLGNLLGNWYAGHLLHVTATKVEQQQQQQQQEERNENHHPDNTVVDGQDTVDNDHHHHESSCPPPPLYHRRHNQFQAPHDPEMEMVTPREQQQQQQHNESLAVTTMTNFKEHPVSHVSHCTDHHHHNNNNNNNNNTDRPSTPIVIHDYIQLTKLMVNDSLGNTSVTSRWFVHTAIPMVMMVYYTNISLVLGDYLLVMSHAIVSLVEETASSVWTCYPMAGLVATVTILIVGQFQSLSSLGRTLSLWSLLALLIVLIQCLMAIQQQQQQQLPTDVDTGMSNATNMTHGTDTDISDNVTRSLFGFWHHPTTTPSPRWMEDDPQSVNVTTLPDDDASLDDNATIPSLFRKLAALGSVGFAIGSQKLFLNVRHELANREMAPLVLGLALASFGTLYIVVSAVAGPNPPSLLLNAIPENSISRQVAGLLLWAHVLVSYAINSQALCSSLLEQMYPPIIIPSTQRSHNHESDHETVDKQEPGTLTSERQTVGDTGFVRRPLDCCKRPSLRWFWLTTLIAIFSYLISNAIPFFKDLVSLIGALTSVPLSLVFPAVLYRQQLQIPIWGCRVWTNRRRRHVTAVPQDEDETNGDSRNDETNGVLCNDTEDSISSLTSPGSYALLLFSVVFMILAAVGTFYSIVVDWEDHGPPFSCR